MLSHMELSRGWQSTEPDHLLSCKPDKPCSGCNEYAIRKRHPGVIFVLPARPSMITPSYSSHTITSDSGTESDSPTNTEVDLPPSYESHGFTETHVFGLERARERERTEYPERLILRLRMDEYKAWVYDQGHLYQKLVRYVLEEATHCRCLGGWGSDPKQDLCRCTNCRAMTDLKEQIRSLEDRLILGENEMSHLNQQLQEMNGVGGVSKMPLYESRWASIIRKHRKKRNQGLDVDISMLNECLMSLDHDDVGTRESKEARAGTTKTTWNGIRQ